MVRYLFIMFSVMALVIGSAWVWVIKSPMSFLDYSYPVLRAKMDMASQLPTGSIAIIGDSRALVGLVPARLGPDVYNLAYSGVSPIEVLAYTRLVLAGPHPPRAVILSLSPFRCITDSTFWDYGVSLGLLDSTFVEDAWQRSRHYPDDLILAPVNHDTLDPAVRTPLFGPPSLGEVEARLKKALYTIRFPSIYLPSLEAGSINQRKEENDRTYRQVLETRGHKLLWTAEGSRDLNPETTAASFAPSPLLDSYLSEAIGLFQQRNIPVYFVACPINEETAAALQPGFAEQFEAYVQDHEKNHPNFHILGPMQDIRPWTDFGGEGHLNARGADAFSDEIHARLREAGLEPN